MLNDSLAVKLQTAFISLLAFHLLNCGDDTSAPPFCENDSQCKDGRYCSTEESPRQEDDSLFDQNYGVCSLVCSDQHCRIEQQECTSLSAHGECKTVTCGRKFDCPSLEFCDVSLHSCYPLDGKCSSRLDCPWFFGTIETDCSSRGYCIVEPNLLPSKVDFGVPIEISLMSPIDDSVLDDIGKLEIRWQTPHIYGAIYLFIARSKPREQVIADDVIWISVQNPSTLSAFWKDGMAYSPNGIVSLSDLPPTDVPLVVFALRYLEGKLVSQSDSRTFFYGQKGWAKNGDQCDIMTNLDRCISRDVPMECIDGFCRYFCSSDLDCGTYGLSCSSPERTTGYRWCI